MKTAITLVLCGLTLMVSNLVAQTSCSDIVDYVKSKGYGITYYSYSSDAISQITFYEVTDANYKRNYFAIVRFKGSYSDYIYQVGSNTKSNYGMYYNESAGKAFWKYIEPYSDVLGCAPDLD